MDKLNIKNKIIFLFAICLLTALSVVSVCALSATSSEAAMAAEIPEIVSTTAVSGFSFSSGSVSYSRAEYGYSDGYAKDIEIEYNLGSASFYKINVIVDGTEFEGEKKVSPADGSLTYRVNMSGNIEVKLVAYSDTDEVTTTLVSKVKSDTDAPSAPAAPAMDKFYKTGSLYRATINLADFTDDLSGKKEAYYLRSDEEGAPTKINDVHNAISFDITEKTTVILYFFDSAYNCVTKEYVFDSFDDNSPPDPVITVTSTSDMTVTGGYTAGYYVDIDYGEDTESGIGQRVCYINGRLQDESTHILLQNSLDYQISAYSVDNCGNYSETATAEINQSTFDLIQPTLNVVISYDVSAAKPAIITAYASDSQSGIRDIRIADTDYLFTQIAEGIYELKFDCCAASSAVINAFDRVGNRTVFSVSFNHFNDKSFAEKVKTFSQAYGDIDFSEYTDKSAEAIKNAYDKLSLLIASDASTQEDFDYAFKSISDLISGENSFLYTIEKKPAYLSGALTYTVDPDDFNGFLKGDEIKLVFSADGNSNKFLSESGFKNGFSENFSLTVFYNSEQKDVLSHGMKISLNMPVGFYERDYALFDADTGERIEIELINNKLEFTLDKSGNYSLVISGEPTVRSDATVTRSVTVFGRKISLAAFLGVVIGGVALMAVGIVIVIVVFRKRGV